LLAFNAVRLLPFAAGSVAGNRASGTVPDPRLLAFSAVRFTPLAAGRVAGNLASGTVPEARLLALSAVRLLPLAATTFPEASRKDIFSAGNVQKIVLVPELQFTAASLLLD
jgi:hypothetical protein